MSHIAQALNHITNARRLELLSYVSNAVKNTVQTGPFKGMTILPMASWGDGDTGAKWLGVYESELHNSIEDAVGKDPDCVINIGCAEGYYIVGLLKRLPNAKGIAVDISESAVKITQENANANNVTVEAICQTVDTNWLEQTCSLYTTPLLVVDCEGAELELLKPDMVPSLKNTSVIVECHDCMIAGITDELTKRFSNTHNVMLFEQTTKDPYQFDFLKSFSDYDKLALVSEGRPSSMNWLYITPKTP